jgi:hypothetical protein
MRYEEERIQEVVVHWARVNYPGIMVTCAPATAKSPQQGARNKRLGLLRGWPDLFFAEPRGGFNGLFIELKTRTGKLDGDGFQLNCLTELNDRGYRAIVCYGEFEAISTITEYMKLPGIRAYEKK